VHRSSLLRLAVSVLAVALALPVTPAALAGDDDPSAPAPAEPTLAALIGQKLVVRMDGPTPSVALLGRVQRGEIGGIVLFGSNLTTQAALVAAVDALEAAAAAGGQPPLLIMADQEGGGIRRIPWAPPASSARAMGANGRTTVIETRGRRAGTALLASGVNVDLAPVADVPSSTDSFMYRARRTFSFGVRRTGRLALAFARGLASAGVIATVKHFPGIGRVRLDTDRFVQTVTASRSALAADLSPFRRAIAAGVPMIMLSNATYTAYDPDNAAGWSPAIATTLLRQTLGFTGVSITDSLSGTAHARGVPARELAAAAARAGTDMVMLTGDEASTARAFDYLLAEAASGSIPVSTLGASYDRILALKATLGP
jgi:beta-N-acetylhexosaminidase